MPKKKRNKKKFKKGISHYAGETLTWVPGWRGAHDGKRWSQRIKEIQKNIDKKEKSTVTSKVVIRRSKDSHSTENCV